MAAALAWLLALVPAGCGEEGYSQDTPDATLRTARLMVERGEAQRLVTLVHADSREMAAVLKRLGSLLGNLQELGREVSRAFPQEVEQLKADIQKGSESGRAQGLIQAFTGGRMPRDRGAARAQQDQFALLVRSIFADPFGWLADQEGRLSTAFVDDSTVAILYDGKPVIPVIGLLMREHKGRWYIELPTNVPGADQFLPRTREEYSVIGSLIRIFDQAVIDLTADVRTGRVSSLDGVAGKAGEKAFIPMVMAFYAYSRLLESRTRGPGPR
jgi:hypothetical protein